MSVESAALVSAWIAIVILAFAMSGLLRQLRELQNAGLPDRAAFLGPPLRLSLNDLPVSQEFVNSVLLFVDGSCRTCETLLSRLKDFEGPTRFVVLFRNKADADLGEIEVKEDAHEMFAALSIRIVPYWVHINADGDVMASEPLGSMEKFEAFLARLPSGGGAHEDQPAGHSVNG